MVAVVLASRPAAPLSSLLRLLPPPPPLLIMWWSCDAAYDRSLFDPRKGSNSLLGLAVGVLDAEAERPRPSLAAVRATATESGVDVNDDDDDDDVLHVVPAGTVVGEVRENGQYESGPVPVAAPVLSMALYE